MEQNTHIKMDMFPLDLDLAESQLDLSSWLFQDDIYVQQDFCEGAKNVDSFSDGRQESIPCSDFHDFQSWMEDVNSKNWNKPCNLEDLFPYDNKQQEDPLFINSIETNQSPCQILSDKNEMVVEESTPLQSCSSPLQSCSSPLQSCSSPLQSCSSPLQSCSSPLQSCSSPLQSCSSPLQSCSSPLQSCSSPLQTYSSPMQSCSSPLQTYSSPMQSYSSPLQSYSSPERSYTFSMNGIVDDQRPQIISVPIIEAVKQESVIEAVEKKPNIKAIKKPIINISAIEHVDTSEDYFKPYITLQSPFSAHNSRPVVINVKKVSIPSTATTSVDIKLYPAIPKASSPTLKEAVQSSDYDDLINEFLMPKEQCPEFTESVEYMDEDFENGVSFTSESSIQEGDFITYIADESCQSDNERSQLLSPDSGMDIENDMSDNCSYISDGAEETLYNVTKKTRHSPYSSQERKLRKKEQNRRAALRYRQKKKNEEGGVQEVVEILERKNEELKKEYESVSAELKMVKKLMKDFYFKRN